MPSYSGLTVATGTIIAKSWADDVRDSVVNVFASAAARTSAIPSPTEGMVSYLSDTDRVDYYVSGAWRPIAGILARGNRSSSSTTTTTEVGVLRLDSIPVLSGHAYRISTGPIFLLSSVTGDTVQAKIRASTSGAATTSSPTVGNDIRQPANSSQPPSAVLSVVYTATATGTLSVLLSVARAAGTGNVSINGGSDLYVEELGVDPGDTGVDV